ncbi:MAG: DUF2384 domain-containing protein [Pseudobdellovibrionaceae bacterium]|nr:DUF2384 domain-containing protein [Bdellovibrionales bacterium]USN47240.1 MAG: DUF2384 domain-containing protein [Pseudobdellovibrionaceae bacterium]
MALKNTVAAERKAKKGEGSDDNNNDKKKLVLRKATLRAADYLGLNNQQLSEILKVSAATISRIRNGGDYYFNLDSNEADKSLLLIRIYQSLYALIGEDKEQIRKWLNNENIYLNCSPIDAMKKTTGVVNVTEYLDAMRG